MPATFPEISQYIAQGGHAIGIVPSWVLHALGELYTHEVAGAQNNPRIVNYWKQGGILVKVTDDETPWCAAFVGAMLSAGEVKGSLLANAKSYLQWGVPITEPVFGAVVVLNRPPNDWQGHVAFAVGADAAGVHLLGGNQGDRVSIARFDRSRVAGVRWPSGVPVIGTNIVLATTQVNPTTA